MSNWKKETILKFIHGEKKQEKKNKHAWHTQTILHFQLEGLDSKLGNSGDLCILPIVRVTLFLSISISIPTQKVKRQCRLTVPK